MAENMKLAVEIRMENGQFKAEVLNSEKLTKQFGQSGKKGFDDLAAAAGRAPGPVGRLASSLGSVAGFASGASIAIYGVVAAIGAWVAGILKGTQIAAEHQREVNRLQATIRATGNAAGKTAEQLDEQAEAMARATLFNDNDIRKAQGILLSFKSVTGDAFDTAIETAANLAEVLGTDLSGSVLQLGKALEDPEQGLSALTRSGVSFTDAQKKVISSLVETGRKGEAMSTILAAINGQLGPTARAAADGYAGSVHRLGESWEDFLEALEKTGPIQGAIDYLDRLLQAGRRAIAPKGEEEFNDLFRERVRLTNELAKIERVRGPFRNIIREKDINARLAEINPRLEQLQDQRIQRDKAAGAAAADGERQAGAAALQASREAHDKRTATLDALDAKYTAERVQAAAAEELKVLEAKSKAGEIGAEQYFERLKKLRLQAVDAEADAVRAALGQAKAEDKGDLASNAKIYELNQRLNSLAQKRRQVATATEAETQQAVTELARQGAEARLAIEVQTLRAQGRETDAAALERQAQYQEFLRDLKLKGEKDAEGIAKAWLDQRVIADELAAVERQADDLLEDLADKRVRIQIDLQAGRINQAEAGRQLSAVDEAVRQELLKERAALSDPKFQGNDAAAKRIRDINRALLDLGQTSNETLDRITREVDGGLADAFQGILDGTKSTKDAFADMGNAVVRILQRIVAEMFAVAAINAVLGIFGQQYSGGKVTPIDTAKGATGGSVAGGAIKRAAGGFVSGPGGPKDDRVPALLSNGEFVVQQTSVRKYGLPFMEMLNSGSLPLFDRPVPAFAAGGLVGGGAPGFGGTGTEVNVYNQAAGAEATVERRRGGNGKEIVDVVVRAVARDIEAGGPVAGALTRTFGTRRTGRPS